MTDYLVKLYDLPEVRDSAERLKQLGIIVRVAMAYEKYQVARWVQENFSEQWAGEVDVAFARPEVSCLLATCEGELVGFACYDSTQLNFFGPLGVVAQWRAKGIGSCLFLTALHRMATKGYAYAIIGGVSDSTLYEKLVGAMEIPGSTPGVYIDRLKPGTT